MTTFSCGPIRVGTLSQTSGVFSGRNVHAHFVAKAKENKGHLTIFGDSAKLNNNHALVVDKDTLDTR